jgi:hypothetical protein
MVVVSVKATRGGDMETVTIEWAPFKLADAVDESRLLRAADAIQADFLAKQPGFIRRELLRGQDGQWVDLIYWESEEAAARAMQHVESSAVCLEYFQLMVGANGGAEPGEGLLHFRRVKTYGG